MSPESTGRSGCGFTAPLRPASPADTRGILELIGGIYAEYGLVLRAALEEPNLLDGGAYFRAHGGEFWVLEHGGRIAATVALKRLDAETAELKTLYVHAGLRGRGLGRRLVAHVIDAARAAGCRRLVLWSDTRFAAAHRLYEALGFARGGVRDLHDSNDSREYEFTRVL